MSSAPGQIAARLRVIAGWMDPAPFAALKAAVERKLARQPLREAA